MSEVTSDILQKRILENIPFGFIQVDVYGKIVWANKSSYKLLELNEAELIGCSYNDLPWDQLDENHKPLKDEGHTIYQALKGHTQASIVRVLKINDRMKWFSVNTSPFYDEEGVLIGAISNFVDITEKKELEQTYKEAEHKIHAGNERYQSLINEAPYAITIYNRDGLLIRANSKCEEYWEIPVKDHVGSFNILNTDHFRDEKSVEIIEKAFRGETGEVTASLPLPLELSEQKSFRIKYYPLLTENGEIENVVFFSEDITDYEKAEQKIRSEEALKQGILDALGDAILVVNERGVILNINRSLSMYMDREGLGKNLVGESILDFIDQMDEREYLREALNSILNQETSFFDYQLKLKDGKWYSLKATPLIGQFGAVISFQNINTRKEIELALEKSLKKYRNIYNKAPVMMHSIDRNIKIISVSDFWLDKMEYERNEVIGRSPAEFLTEQSKDEIRKNLKRLLNEGEIRSIEYQFVKKSGEIMDVLLSAVAEYDDNHRFERSIAGMIDITDQKRAERDLQESRLKLLEAQRISRIGNYELNVVSGEYNASSEILLMMGIDLEHRNISIIEDLIHPDDLEGFKRKLRHSVATGEDFFHIYRIENLKTGKLKWISGRGKMMKGKSGEVERMIGTVQDITEQRRAEDKIKKLTDRVLLATEIANIGVWEYDRDNDQTYWEDQMYKIFPTYSKPINLADVKELLVDDEKERVEENLELIKKGVNFLEGEYKVMENGEIKYLRTFTRILRRENSSLKGMIGVIYDITKDKNLQEELELSLDEKNVLIKEVHHRVKNNMQLISSIMALKSYDLKDFESKYIFEEINTRIKAMSVIHDKLYKFYNVSEIDFSEFLMHISQELQVILGTNKVVINVEVETIYLNIDQALLLGLIVSELVSNAMKHSFKDAESGVINIIFSQLDDTYTLAVLNDGCQVPDDALASKTGLGISLIKTFTKQLRGTVMVDPRNGFKIDF